MGNGECTHKIGIPKILLNGMDISKLNEFTILKVGYSEHRVILESNSHDTSIELPKSLIEDLSLYIGQTSNAYLNNGKLHLGPVVAVFTSKGLIKKAKKQICSPNIQEYLKANETAQCILYFFCIDDVDFIKLKINGMIYNHIKALWEKRSFPIPDVLYDRGGSRREFLNVSNYIRNQFTRISELKKVNAQSFFDKYSLYEVLSKYEDIKPHLPITKSYSKKNLRNLFKESKTLYIKACLGSNGKSVMRVVKESKNLFRYSTARNKIVSKTTNSLSKLIQVIDSFFEGRDLIIQKEIELMKINDCLVDMRATVQRDSKGKLGITIYVVRVGQLQSPVTSTASGSSVYIFEDFFKNIMKYSDKKIASMKLEIDDFLIKIYHYLENEYGSFGEMGLDFGLDANGKLWFIESNSKPAKTTIHLLDRDDVLERSYLYPLEYAKYLASFQK